jgi:hypothetical protein
MDRTLITEDLDCLRKLRDVREGKQSTHVVPPSVAMRLKLRGYVAANMQGEYSITMRGRDELIDRDRDRVLS